MKINYPTLATLAITCLIATACADKSVTPEDVALNDRGVAQMGRFEYKAAHATFSRLVERSPEWLDAQVNLAIATQNRQADGDQHEALAILEGVLAKEPDQPRALYTAAMIHLYLGNTERATTMLTRVVQLDPRDAYAAYFLGQSYLQAGNYEDAAKWFLQTLELDPYLRSSYWAGAQALRRTGNDDQALRLLEDYQRFARNPAARVAGFSYKRMGPKAEARAVTTEAPVPAPLPAGNVFGEPRILAEAALEGASVTTANIDGEGPPDLLLAAEQGLTLLAGGPGSTFTNVGDHPLVSSKLAGRPGTAAAMWGDVDDDGLIDVVLCGTYGSQLVSQNPDRGWVPTDTETSLPCTAGALFDADHDGDLDIFTTGPDGNELLSNNRDGSFRELAGEMGLRGHAGIQVLATDLDGDRDLDILVVNEQPPNDLWQNDRTWQYRPFPGLDDLRDTALLAVTVADTDADGHTELYAVAANGDLLVWQGDGLTWTRRVLRPAAMPGQSIDQAELSVTDFDGDGRPELLHTYRTGFALVDPRNGNLLLEQPVKGLASAIPVILNPGSGPALVTVARDGAKLWPAGSGRHGFLALRLSGRSDGEQMRSNASGIGTRVNVRTAGQWTVLDSLDNHSGPGQSLAPLGVGLGGHQRADFVALEWSDGVSQTEMDLEVLRQHKITETQRQLASCPVVFAWDGQSYAFVSDVLGVGGLGFFDSPGVYAPPRPFEGYLLKGNQLAVRDGRYHVKFSEPMEENAYLDSARIHVYDLPRAWSVVLDERMGIAGPPVTGRAITYRRARDPVRATTATGVDVTALVLTADHVAPPPGEIDKRFIGLLEEEQILTLEFDLPLTGDGAVLVADGWIEYPYSQTVFAAWQAGLRYQAPTLQARDTEGRWHDVAVEFGYPAGMPRKMALPLPELPAGTSALRLSTNMEVYWDRLQIVWEEPLDQATPTTLLPVEARVARTGFAKRTTLSQRLPHYDYANRAPYWDAKFQRGFYTAFGDATELVTEVDGAVAIIGGGEEIHLEFEAAPAPRPGMQRYFVLDFRGWAKDMDLYTEHGETVGPLPILEGMDTSALARREQLHARYNVRFQEGL